MTTTDGSPYCLESMIKEVISSIPTSIEDGRGMFTNDRNVISFENGVLEKNDGKELINLDNLVNAGDGLSNGMFAGSSIISFVGDLTSLETAHSMFYSSDIQSFVSYAPKLTNGSLMFYGCSNLTEFCGDLSTIKNGQSMFYGCYSLHTFKSDLSQLENGTEMFLDCGSLSTFTGKLTSLQDGNNMFLRCKLNYNSVVNILTSILDENQYVNSQGTTLTLGVDKNYMGDVIDYMTTRGMSVTENTETNLKATMTSKVGNDWKIEIIWNLSHE